MKPYLLFVAALVAVCAAAEDDSSSDSSEDVALAGDAAIPSMLGTFGSKIAIADNLYDEYEEDENDQDETNAAEAPSTPCCFPNVWQGRVWSDFGFTPLGRGKQRRADDDFDSDDDKKGKKKHGENCGGRPIVSRSLSQVYVDGANKRMAGNMMEGHSKPAEAAKSKWTNISYIFQVGANSSADLYLFNRKTQKCRHRQMKNVEWTRQCIPSSAVSGGKLSLGPGVGGLTVEAWMFEGSTRRADSLVASPDASATDAATTPRPRPRPRPRMRVGANVLVQPGSCVPVVIQEEGVVFVGGEDYEDSNEIRMNPKPKPKPKWRGEAFVGSAFFSDLKTTITDPTVFTVPSYCKKTSNTLYFDEMEDELPTVLERFLVL